MGKRHYSENIVERVDPRGGKYYWIGGDDLGFAKDDGTDCMAVHEGFISVTPLQCRSDRSQAITDEHPVAQFPWP